MLTILYHIYSLHCIELNYVILYPRAQVPRLQARARRAPWPEQGHQRPEAGIQLDRMI